MPTLSLAVKDVPLDYTGDDKHHFHLTGIYGPGLKSLVLEAAQGAIIWHLRVSSGVPAGMRWHHIARKLVKTDGDIPQLSQINTIGRPLRISCQKQKRKEQTRDITASDMTN